MTRIVTRRLHVRRWFRFWWDVIGYARRSPQIHFRLPPGAEAEWAIVEQPPL